MRFIIFVVVSSPRASRYTIDQVVVAQKDQDTVSRAVGTQLKSCCPREEFVFLKCWKVLVDDGATGYIRE